MNGIVVFKYKLEGEKDRPVLLEKELKNLLKKHGLTIDNQSFNQDQGRGKLTFIAEGEESGV